MNRLEEGWAFRIGPISGRRLGGRAHRWTLLLALCCGVLGGCSGKNSSGQKSAVDVDAASDSPRPEGQEALPPLTPVDAPAEVVLRLRVKNPEGLADGLMASASLPLDLRKLLMLDEQAARALSAFDLQGSIEAALVLNLRNPAQPYSFFSVGALGVSQVLSFLEKEGVDSQQAPGGVHLFLWNSQPCAVGRSIASSPARVVCSRDSDSLRRMLPYALRGLPGHEMSDANAHVELDLRPVRHHYEKELGRVRLLASVLSRQAHIGHAKFDSAVTDAVSGGVSEIAALLNDTDLVTARLYEEKGDLRLLVSTEFSGRSSTTVRSVLALSKEQGPAPAVFDALPATASSAGYSRHLPESVAEPWMSVLADLASGRAEHDGASAEFSKRMTRLVRGLGPHGGASSMGQGPLVQGKMGGEKILTSAWVLWGSERKKAELVEVLSDIAWILSSEELKKLLPEQTKLPQLKQVQLPLSGAAGATVFRWKLPQKEELKPHLDDVVSQEFQDVSVLDSIERYSEGYIAVHQWGDHSWITWGRTSQELIESYRILQADSGQELGELGSLDGVRDEPAVVAGYAKLEGTVGLLAWLMPPKLVGSWSGLLLATPHRGQVPLRYFHQILEGEKVSTTWRLEIPAAYTQDAATLAVMLAAEVGLALDEGK